MYGGGFNSFGGGGCGVGGFCKKPEPDFGCEQGRSSYGGSTFVLIVVLFILLIIVGRSFASY